MPTLIIQEPGRRTGGFLSGRVLIGRLPTNGIALADSSVSRLHAWIEADPDGRSFVGDSGSLTGTWVNGRTIEKRKMLADGDVVRVGHAQITFSMDDELPDDVTPIDLGGYEPSRDVAEAGVLFDCPCGAPVWFKAGGIGQAHHCRHCGRTFRVPDRSGVVAETVAPPPFVEPGIPTEAAAAAPPDVSHVAEELHEDSLHGVTDETVEHVDEHGLAEHAEGAAGEVPVEGEGEEAIEAEAAGAGPEVAAASEEFDIAVAPQADEPADADVNAIQELPQDAVPEEWPAELPAEEAAPPAAEPEPEPVAVEVQPVEYAAGLAAGEPAATASEPGPELAEAPAEWLAPPEIAPESDVEQICSICRSAIGPEEESTACPSCGLTFHAECWKQNLGCSAYGCDQVGVLQKPEPQLEPVEDLVSPTGEIAMPAPLRSIGVPPTVDEPEQDQIADEAAELDDRPPVWQPAVMPEDEAGFPWDFAFLGAAVGGVFFGVLAYGIPSLIGAIGTMIYLIGFRDRRRGKLVASLALVVCLLGAAGGVYASYLYWAGWPPIGPFAHVAAHPGGTR